MSAGPISRVGGVVRDSVAAKASPSEQQCTPTKRISGLTGEGQSYELVEKPIAVISIVA